MYEKGRKYAKIHTKTQQSKCRQKPKFVFAILLTHFSTAQMLGAVGFVL
jgi:hypothetical protein